VSSPAEFLWIAIPGISSAAYGLLFFLRRQELGNVSRWFSAFLGFAMLWSLASMLLHANLNVFAPVWSARFVILGNAGIPLAIFGFTVNFLSLHRQQTWIPITVALFIITALCVFGGLVVVSTDVSQGLVTNRYGVGMIAVAATWSCCFYPALFLLIRELRRTKDPTFGNRIKYVLITFVLLLVASLLNVTPLSAYPIDHLLTGVTAIVISLSISRYQLLEIQQAVRRLGVFILAVVLYIIAASGVLYVLAGLSRELILPMSVLGAMVTAALLFAYSPVRQGLARLIDRIFFPEHYNVHTLIYAISRTSNRLRSSNELGIDILTMLTKALLCENASLFVKQEVGVDYTRIASLGADVQPAPSFRADSPLVKELASYRLGMHVDRLQELSRMRALWIDEWQALGALKTAVLVPVNAENELIGFFVLGARQGNEPYTRKELTQTLPLLANQVSIALANSRLYVQEQTRANQLARTNQELREAQVALRESADHVRRQAARAEALVRIADRLNAQLELTTVLNAVCEETASAVGVTAASVSLYSEKTNLLYHAAGFGLPSAYERQTQPLPRAVYDGYSHSSGTLTITPDLHGRGDLPDAALCNELDIHTIMLTSMMREGQLVGSLNIFVFGQAHHFSEDDLALLKGIAAQAAQAIVNARLYADAQRRLKNVESLRAVDAAITGSMDLHATLQIILNQVASQLSIDAADVLLLDSTTNTLQFAEGHGFQHAPLQRAPVHLFQHPASLAVLERRQVYVPNLAEDASDDRRALSEYENFVAYFGVPLIAKNQVKGVLEIYQRAPLEPGQEWLSFLEALSVQAAIAIDNHELFASLQRSNTELSLAYESTLEGWARALELRDQETQGHTRRVAAMTVKLARWMGVAEEDIIHIRRGAVLHDIGKMAIPDSILLKPGPLTSEEWKTMRQHPVYAYQMLSSIPFLRRALDIPYSHHEWWNGNGYPQALKGEEIPLWARMFAVVDVWDALRSDRPYHDAMPDDEVRAQLIREAGTHFDPSVVEAFLQIPETEWRMAA
jgi:putative nucleotidyltransferase with HDIG domain